MRTAFSFILMILFPSVLPSQEWTRFRGPNGSGISPVKSIPVEWTAEDYLWKRSLKGTGGSSPVIWGSQLYLTGADVKAGERYLFCVDTANGKDLWTKTFPFQKYKKQKNNTYASSTPAVDQDHVYVLWQSPTTSPLIAFDHQGKKVWEVDLGPYKHGQGGATSPIVFQDHVIVANDHKAGSFLIAVDRKTGKTQWKIPREGKRACYATPGIYQPNGEEPQVIFSHSFEGVIGVDLKTGKQKWHIDPFGRFPQRAIGCPVMAGELIIAGSGFTTGKKNVVAIHPEKTANGFQAKEVYRLSRSMPHIPSPLVYDKWLFLWSDTGIVTCADVKTGKVIWKERARGSYFGSPVCVNGRLYCIDKQGTVVVIAASEKFQVLARNPLGEASQATPAIANGVMYLRTDSQLLALKGQKAP